MKNLFSTVSEKLAETKTKVALASATAVASVAPTLCLPPELEKITDLVFEIAKWAGGIITFVGVVMVAKAFMDSTSGQSQPGSLGKAIGIAVLGASMLAGRALLAGIV